ncbi:hypothetical protein GCM10009007_20220 [Formosimonas limnophila]|uniref:Uncharacterized protein n=1 Tax=Formosimonas limnophila TaxID=1384487 RepID=A0A8J3CNP4_9BURK|nr:hypothetical protein GCM10009007_20220 [Formosimonas limnophila]
MPGNSPMSISLDEFVKKWGGIQSDYQPLIDWFEWAPMTISGDKQQYSRMWNLTYRNQTPKNSEGNLNIQRFPYKACG